VSEFVLQPFRHRLGKLAPDRRKETLVLTVEEVIEKFGLNPKQQQLDQIRLNHMRPGSYVGISIGRQSKQPVCFVLTPPGGVPSYAWILKQDPTFDDRIQEVYRIEKARWDGKIEEVPT